MIPYKFKILIFWKVVHINIIHYQLSIQILQIVIKKIVSTNQMTICKELRRNAVRTKYQNRITLNKVKIRSSSGSKFLKTIETLSLLKKSRLCTIRFLLRRTDRRRKKKSLNCHNRLQACMTSTKS